VLKLIEMLLQLQVKWMERNIKYSLSKN